MFLRKAFVSVATRIAAYPLAWRAVRQRRQMIGKDVLGRAPVRPSQISIEVTNLCNANCTFCGYQYQKRPIGFIEPQLFRNVIDQYSAIGGGPLGLTPVVGDALVDKALPEKIAYAASKKNIHPIGLTTNAILLTPVLFERLVSAGLSQIDISLSGLDRDEYKRIYRKDSYPKIRRNLLDIASSDLRRHCKIRLSLRTDSLLPWLRRDYFLFRRLGYPISGTTFYDNWSGRIANSDLSGRMMVRPGVVKRLPCRMLYSGPTVLANGKMTACGCRDMDGNSDLILGDVRTVPLIQPWVDGTMQSLRRRFLEGDLPDICRDCRHYNPVGDSDLVNKGAE